MNRLLKAAALALTLVAVASPTTADAQQTRRLNADKSNDYGVVYRLPQTGVEITANATRTVSKAGPFFQYAAKFIGTDKVVREDETHWTLDNLSTAVYGVADPDESYVLQVKPGSSVSISVADDGMLLGINTDAEPPYRPTAYKPALPKENTKPIDEYLKFVDEDFLACQSTYKQAEMLAAALMEIREARISLTRGTAETMPTDGRQLELMLASLQDQEDAIKRAFTGETITDSYTRTYLVMPEEEGEQIVFRFSEFDGFVEADDLSGEPVNMDLRIVSEPETPLDVKGEPKKLPKDAVVYNIPATARVTLTHDGRKMAQKDYGFGQFGTTFGLQPTLFSDKKEPYRATFTPADGALLRLEPLQ